MKPIDLTNTKIGDTLAVQERCSWSGTSHRLLIVYRITATQVCCRDSPGGSIEWRFRKSDGKQIGEDYRYAELGTPELVARINDQIKRGARLNDARRALSDLEGKYLHQLKLTLEQTEALAKAWAEVKAMKVA